MDIGAIIIIIIIGIVLVLTFYIIGAYNTLLDAKNKVEDKFTPIDKALKKLEDIASNLLEVLTKYAKYEEKLIHEIEKNKNKMTEANTINDKIKAYNIINKTIKKVLSLEESYKEIRSSRKYNSLVKELNEIEDKITYAKNFYNEAVDNYNKQRKIHPFNIIATVFKFNDIDLL